MVTLKIITENRDNCEFKGEGGLCVLVDAFGNKFLLDTGYSNLFVHNAELLNIDLSSIETVVLTHGHSDHTNGVPYLASGRTIIMHPAGFKARWSIRKKEYAGFPMSFEELSAKHKVIATKEPYKICDNAYFLGEIPMKVSFEQNGNFSTTLDAELTQKDYTEDDSGVAITTSQGLFVMTGCGHRGICNTIERAKAVTGHSKVWGVFGGFHLRNLEKQKELIDHTIEYFKASEIKTLYLGHCVTDEVIEYFEKNMLETKIYRLASGKEFNLNLSPVLSVQLEK